MRLTLPVRKTMSYRQEATSLDLPVSVCRSLPQASTPKAAISNQASCFRTLQSARQTEAGSLKVVFALLSASASDVAWKSFRGSAPPDFRRVGPSSVPGRQKARNLPLPGSVPLPMSHRAGLWSGLDTLLPFRLTMSASIRLACGLPVDTVVAYTPVYSVPRPTSAPALPVDHVGLPPGSLRAPGGHKDSPH